MSHLWGCSHMSQSRNDRANFCSKHSCVPAAGEGRGQQETSLHRGPSVVRQRAVCATQPSGPAMPNDLQFPNPSSPRRPPAWDTLLLLDAWISITKSVYLDSAHTRS